MILFLHIERTAGTSAVKAFKSAARTVGLHQGAWLDPRVRERLRKNGKQIDLVHGHFPWGLHEGLGIQAEYVTLLREPVVRAVSHYVHSRHTGEWMGTFEEFIERPRMRNLMVQRIAGMADLDLALKRLNKFGVFGLTENTDEFRARIALRYGWRLPGFGYENVGVYDRDDFNAAIEQHGDRIRELNELDIQLYERARQWLMNC